MKIIRAAHLGMCFGVRDAIALAHHIAIQEPLTILGDLVHNQRVLNGLEAKGVRTVDQLENVNTAKVMITAHGTSEKTLSRIRDQKLGVIEATCPLVHFAHRSINALVAQGYHPVIIGKRSHVEVRGMTDDLKEFDVVISEEDIATLREKKRFGVIAQTTQPIEKVRTLAGSLRRRFPNSEVRFVDTVCQPTKQRQSAAIELAKRCDVVIVAGGAHSNNTSELVATCARFCPHVHHVQSAEELREEWFNEAAIVGITAGTSTPEITVAEIESRLTKFANRYYVA